MVKIVAVVAIIAVVGGVIVLFSRSRSIDAVSYDEWPTVPPNPAS